AGGSPGPLRGLPGGGPGERPVELGREPEAPGGDEALRDRLRQQLGKERARRAGVAAVRRPERRDERPGELLVEHPLEREGRLVERDGVRAGGAHLGRQPRGVDGREAAAGHRRSTLAIASSSSWVVTTLPAREYDCCASS